MREFTSKQKIWYNLTVLVFICIVFFTIKNYTENQIKNGIEIRGKSTKEKLLNKVIDTCKVAHSTIYFEFSDGSKFIFGYWSFKRGLLSEVIQKGDTINKDANSNLVRVSRKNDSFIFYIMADTNNLEWRKKNLPNTDYMAN